MSELLIDFPSGGRTTRKDLVIRDTSSSTRTNNSHTISNSSSELYVSFPDKVPLKRKWKRRLSDRFRTHEEENNDDRNMIPNIKDTLRCEHLYAKFEEITQCKSEILNSSHNANYNKHRHSYYSTNIESQKRRISIQKRLSETFHEIHHSFDHDAIENAKEKANEWVSTRKSCCGFRSCAKRASKVMEAFDSSKLNEEEIIEMFTRKVFFNDLSK